MIFGKVFTVSEVNLSLKELIHKDPTFANLQIQGEVSNFRRYASGHCYFNLKDSKGLIKCVMFKGAAQRLKKLPRDGDQVVGIGRIDVYERDGVYQFYVDMLMPVGTGDLMAAYEALKQKLSAEGLFDETRKQPIPVSPRIVGVVTSADGAAIRDIIKVAGRRDSSVKIRLYPVKVQGKEAPPEIAAGIHFMNRHNLCDVLIVGRGGGSMEDLWAFNDEKVVRAIAASRIPIISAVGHEIDFTLSDFAADKRAATPSQAAEFAVPDRSKDIASYEKLNLRLKKAVADRLAMERQCLDGVLQRPVFRYPERLTEGQSQRLDQLGQSLSTSFSRRLERETMRLMKLRDHWFFRHPEVFVARHQDHLTSLTKDLDLHFRYTLSETQQRLKEVSVKFQLLDPQKVLERGYTMTEGPGGKILSSMGTLKEGDTIKTYFKDGVLRSIVSKKEES